MRRVKLVDWNEGIFDPSSLKDYLQCPRKGYLKHILGIRPKQEKLSPIAGRVFHAALAAYYKSGMHEALRTLATEWEAEGGFKLNIATLVRALLEYAETYKDDYYVPVESTLEMPFQLRMSNGTILAGRKDGIFRDKTLLIDIDHKTTLGILSDYWFEQWENDFALLAYYYAALTLIGNCHGTLINGIRLDRPATIKKEDVFYSRRIIPRTELQIAEFLNTYVSITNRILDAGTDATKFPLNQQACHGIYGRCPYKAICMYGLHASIVEADYKTVDTRRWSDD